MSAIREYLLDHAEVHVEPELVSVRLHGRWNRGAAAGSQRELDREDGAGARLALDADRAAVRLDD
jgi:hypothetical protein